MSSSAKLILLGLFFMATGLSFAGNAATPIKASVNAADSSRNLPAEELTISQQIDKLFIPFVDALSEVLFFDPFSAAGVYDEVVRDDQGNPVLNQEGEVVTAPLKFIVVWLILGGLFFTLFMRFINVRALMHSINLIRGKYDKPGNKGEVFHFHVLRHLCDYTGTFGRAQDEKDRPFGRPSF